MYDIYDSDFDKAFDEAVDEIDRKQREVKPMKLKDAEKLIELIDDDIAALNKDMSREGYDVCLCTLQMVKQYIKALPTAEPIKHGRWKYTDYGGVGNWHCSVCHNIVVGAKGASLQTPYCPNCGADMRERRNDE